MVARNVSLKWICQYAALIYGAYICGNALAKESKVANIFQAYSIGIFNRLKYNFENEKKNI